MKNNTKWNVITCWIWNRILFAPWIGKELLQFGWWSLVVGVELLICSSTLTLPLLLRQEEDKHLPVHSALRRNSQSIKPNSVILIWRLDRKILANLITCHFFVQQIYVFCFGGYFNFLFVFLAVQWMTFHHFFSLHNALCSKNVCLNDCKEEIRTQL